MSVLELIKQVGTMDENCSRNGKPSGLIRCADGFTMSVQTGGGAYCIPRFSPGPYTEAQVGYPSERPEPWDAWSELAYNLENPTGTVYGFVPFEMIEALVALHGGEVAA